MPSPNKQPIFVGTPILITRSFPINLFNTLKVLDPAGFSPLTILEATATEGTLIERITIRALASPQNDFDIVSTKLVYLWIYGATTTNWSVYDVFSFTSTTVSATTPPPYVQLEIPGGLILSTGDILAVNQTAFTEDGDGLSVTLEGGTYTAV